VLESGHGCGVVHLWSSACWCDDARQFDVVVGLDPRAVLGSVGYTLELTLSHERVYPGTMYRSSWSRISSLRA
jgi:hypothetical protein